METTPLAHVLVVDDDVDVAELVRTVLTIAGYSVAVAVDGRRGLDAASAQHPDLIVLDWMMPAMTGIEVCRTLRQDRAFDDTRIIMLTARSTQGDIDAARAAGADDYVVKPFAPRELRRRVAELLAP